MQILHNPRCSKSRQALLYLTDKGIALEVIDYMKNPLSKKDLKLILSKLKLKPIEWVRTEEKIWKEQYKGKNLSDEEILEAMEMHPQLIQRPVIINGDKAVIGRPTEKIEELL